MKLKSIYKSITKYPLSTSLNVLSLVIAFSGIITLLLYVSYEKSFDKYNKNYERVYKVTVGKDGASVPAVMASVIRENLPHVEAISPLWHTRRLVSIPKVDEKAAVFSTSGFFAENDILDIFTFNFIYGNRENALTLPNTIVLTQSLATKLFGDKDPLGQTVNLQDEAYTCTAVVADFPDNSSISADFITSFVTYSQDPNHWTNSWEEWSFRIFLKIDNTENYSTVLANLNGIKELNDHIRDDELNESKNSLFLLPLKELHFGTDGQYKSTNRILLDVLVLLAIILAIMGMVNFINLMTSQAMQRAKVFSIKNVLGASRGQVVSRIIFESVAISLFALAIALILHSVLSPMLENVLQIKGLAFYNRESWYFRFVFMAVVFGLIAGFYPAKFITSVDVAQSIKGGILFSGKGKTIRNLLLLIQFSFTILLIIGAIAIEKQIDYWQNFDTGIQEENIIYLPTTDAIRKHEDAFTREVLSNPNIQEYCYAQFVPGNVGMGWGRTVGKQQISLWVWPVDERFIDFFGVQIEDGRKFSSNLEADKNNFILNRAAVTEFQWQKPTERIIPGFGFEGQVIGVCKDFNYATLKNKIQPMALWLTDERHNIFFVKAGKKHIKGIIAHLKDSWYKFEKKADFDYHFLDQFSERLYEKEERIAHFIEFVALWSILLSLTGLLGLALFMARQRTKEIGIRRANGATITEIIIMLNKSFLRWILLAFVIATPIAYYAINKWMENFAYKMPLSWWIFALAGGTTLIVAIVAVSLQTFRVAAGDVVEALRWE